MYIYIYVKCHSRFGEGIDVCFYSWGSSLYPPLETSFIVCDSIWDTIAFWQKLIFRLWLWKLWSFMSLRGAWEITVRGICLRGHSVQDSQLPFSCETTGFWMLTHSSFEPFLWYQHEVASPHMEPWKNNLTSWMFLHPIQHGNSNSIIELLL